MRIANLAEAVILQALGDLFDGSFRRESVRFLTGEGFRIAADIAKVSPNERAEILTIFGKLYDRKGSFVDLKKAARGNWP